MNLGHVGVAADLLLLFAAKTDFMNTEELKKLSDYFTSRAMVEESYPLKKFLYDSAEFVESTLGESE